MTNATQKPKQKTISIICCLLGGMLGIHKFYEEKYLMGVLYILTCGFCLIGVVIDLIKLIQQPSVYYVEKRSFHFDPNAVKDKILNFPVDKVGKIVAIAGGVVVGFGCSQEFNLKIILIGLGIALVGIVISFLKSHNFLDALIDAGIPAGIAAVAVFAILLLIAFVIVWLILKLLLGIDLLKLFGIDLFGEEEKSSDSVPDVSVLDAFTFPSNLYDKQGNQYRLESISGDHADYYCPATGERKVVWESDLNSD